MKISVVIVTYNAEKWIPFCFNSLRNNTVPFKVIIIDNASADNTVQILKSKYPEFELIQSKQNLGFGKANNIGISKAYKDGSEFVFLLNQDACVEPDTIQKITNLHKQHSEFGIVSPIHLAENGHVVDKTFLSYITDKNHNAFISDKLADGNMKPLYEFPFINAAIWSVSRKCIEKVGAFDGLFSHYGEDTDYCKRVIKRGFKIGVAPSIKAIHNRAQESERVTVDKEKKMFITYLLNFKQPDSSLTKIAFSHFVHSLKFFTLSAVKLKFGLLLMIIKVNFKLLQNRSKIIHSRVEQSKEFAFLNTTNS